MSNLTADLEFQKEILPGVSRTFALTIPQLPAKIQDAVANAYLLCRIADTIEDTTLLSTEQKEKYHEQFIHVVCGEESAQQFAQKLTVSLDGYSHQDELRLIENSEKVINITHSFTPTQRQALERCIKIMSEGMEFFERQEEISIQNNTYGVATMTDMDKYCYYVAGVVGEMLTDLFCDYSKRINSKRKQLSKLAVSFGQGLQMTNILKDIWDDQQRNTCWLPREIFAKHGFDLSRLKDNDIDKNFEKGLERLLAVAHHHLSNALEYTLLIPAEEVGIRRFCLWAIGMAVLTLRKLSNNKDFSDSRQVKISRNSVKATILVSNTFVKQDKILKILFRLISRSIPQDNSLNSV
ncbi:MAG: phytoene/squalene synthase family protein [Gammaproteobacteria bacterium]|nr:MAG: phytoene/squalene synthase family protein [Gammaproteobacteria bacterium]